LLGKNGASDEGVAWGRALTMTAAAVGTVDAHRTGNHHFCYPLVYDSLQWPAYTAHNYVYWATGMHFGCHVT
jgi:hypothetical protein